MDNFIIDKKDISNKSNNTNYNLNKSKNATKNTKNQNLSYTRLNNKGKISNEKTNILLQKKKNIFRIGQKLKEKTYKNISTTNNIYLKNNNNYFKNCRKDLLNNNDKDFPFGFSLSNTTKNKINEKAQLQKNNKEKNGSKNFNKGQFLFHNNIFYDRTNTLNYNYINKKYKYTNLLEQLENKTIKTNCSLNNKSQITAKSTKFLNGKNILQKKKNN